MITIDNDFFKIGSYYLDQYQIDSILDDEHNILLVAGAGSGKTLTILGKIKYLIEIKKIKQEDILCISFTNETVKSLEQKLSEMNYYIEVKTFHKLGLKILENKNMTICDEKYLDYIIDEYFKSYIKYNNKRKRLFKNILFTDKNIDKIYKHEDYYSLKKLTKTFINLAKSNDLTELDIYNFYKNALFNEKELLHIFLDIFIIYKRELESTNKTDFNDMITLAKKEVKNTRLNYKYIIIDEFQDTSLVRLNLIKEIMEYTSAKIFVVGDDWQSIYRFSGCNLDIFINFSKYIPNVKVYYLKYTYRNSKELIHVSANFIMRNKRQLKKEILSPKSLNKPIKVLINYSLNDTLDLISDKDDLMILGRNNKDIENIEHNNKYTIHRSKGLEAKNVILVNSETIPSLTKNDRILRFVLNTRDYILHEEERRLFYVALTRTKEAIYILVNDKKSSFVKELIHDYKKYIEIKKK